MYPTQGSPHGMSVTVSTKEWHTLLEMEGHLGVAEKSVLLTF